MMPLPFEPDCYWVVPAVLLAGEYPGSYIESKAIARLGALLDAGIRTFVDLTESHELASYKSVLMSAASDRAISVSYHRKPIRDLDVPSALRMREILTTIRTSIERGDPVYVHCWGGIGRTGTVVGCWLVETRRADEDAIAVIAALREKTRSRNTPSPESIEQVSFVRSWPA